MNYLVDTDTTAFLETLGKQPATSRAFRSGFYSQYPETYRAVHRLSLNDFTVTHSVIELNAPSIDLSLDQVRDLMLLPDVPTRLEYIKVLTTEQSTQ